MIVLIDQDQVITDFENRFLKIWRQRYPRRMFVPLEKRRNFLIEDDYPKSCRRTVMRIKREKNFFLGMPMIPGARQALGRISKMGHSIFICTAPMPDSPYCHSEKYWWLKKHLGSKFAERLVITSDKTLVHGDFLIDDKPKITGAVKPSWQHIIFDAPHNQHVANKPHLMWTNWQTILLPLLKKGGGSNG